MANRDLVSMRTGSPNRGVFAMSDDFDEDDDEAWAVHDSARWYFAVFLAGVVLAALVGYAVSLV